MKRDYLSWKHWTLGGCLGSGLWVLAATQSDQSAGPACLSSTPVRLASASPPAARPGDRVTLRGEGFGFRPGTTVLTGRRLVPRAWTDTTVVVEVPDDGASGQVYVRRADGARSNPVAFTAERSLPAGQIAPHGLMLEETGLPGAAFLVETDGTCLNGISGFETLCTYELRESGPHAFRGRTYLNQRVADLRVRDGYLFAAGDHGLLVYRCADLRAGRTEVVVGVARGVVLRGGCAARPDGGEGRVAGGLGRTRSPLGHEQVASGVLPVLRRGVYLVGHVRPHGGSGGAAVRRGVGPAASQGLRLGVGVIDRRGQVHHRVGHDRSRLTAATRSYRVAVSP